MNNQNDKFIDSLLSSQGKNINPETLKAAKSGDKNALINSLSAEDKKKIESILSNKEMLNSLLKSPQAAAILKSLSNGGKNG